MSISVRGGEILYASYTLDGTYFENALILLIENNSDGIYGVMVNRESAIPLNEVFAAVSEEDERRVYIGGPVDEDMVFTIRTGVDVPDAGERELVPGIFYGKAWKNSREMIESNESSVYLYLGYAGWKRAQFSEEIAEGSWQLYRSLNLSELLRKCQDGSFKKRRSIEAYLKEKLSE